MIDIRHVQYTKQTIAGRFIEEIFNARKTEMAMNFVTPDIIYHGMAEEVKSLEEFKRGVAKDLSAFPDMKTIILDIFGEENKVAIRWNLKAPHEKDFADSPATQKKSQAEGVDIFHFEGDKIKEAWTVTVLAQ